MRRKHVEDAIANLPTVETIWVVQIADYVVVKERDEAQTRMIGCRDAEIAQLRMVLREALAQLERIHATNKTTAPDYRRLMTRCETVLQSKPEI